MMQKREKSRKNHQRRDSMILETIGTVISLMRDANTLRDSYKMVSGILQGSDTDKIIQRLDQMNQGHNKLSSSIERLSDRILYASDSEAIRDNSLSRQQRVNNLRQQREALDPVQKALGGELLSSAMIWTPEKMQQAFNKNPWEVLFEIRPVSHASQPNNPDLIPFLFHQGGTQYIGWQLKGVLPMMFGCEVNEIWTPSQANGTSRGGIEFDFPVPEMVNIPAGSFQMGSNEYFKEQPIHRVNIKAFSIGKYPVTFAEWDACYQRGGCDHNGC